MDQNIFEVYIYTHIYIFIYIYIYIYTLYTYNFLDLSTEKPKSSDYGSKEHIYHLDTGF